MYLQHVALVLILLCGLLGLGFYSCTTPCWRLLFVVWHVVELFTRELACIAAIMSGMTLVLMEWRCHSLKAGAWFANCNGSFSLLLDTSETLRNVVMGPLCHLRSRGLEHGRPIAMAGRASKPGGAGAIFSDSLFERLSDHDLFG
jgi:hypothetical protein